MVRNGLQRSAMTMIRAVRPISTNAAASKVVVVVARRVEGSVRDGGGRTVKSWNISVVRHSGLPVDGLHPVFKVGRRLELPFANDSPADDDGANRAGNGDKDDDSGFGGFRCGGRGA